MSPRQTNRSELTEQASPLGVEKKAPSYGLV